MLALDVIPIGRMMADPSFAQSIGHSFIRRWRWTMITLDHIIFGLAVLILIGAILVRRDDERFNEKLEIDFEKMKEGEDG